MKKIVLVLVAIAFSFSLVVTSPRTAYAACTGRPTEGLCQAPNAVACPLELKCCGNVSECGVDNGNVIMNPDDDNFTPTQVREDVADKIGADTELNSPGAILSRLLPYLFVFGGLILFVMLIWGGFEMMGGATNAKASENGKNRITAAMKGFVILFVAIWIAQIAETIFGISILGN